MTPTPIDHFTRRFRLIWVSIFKIETLRAEFRIQWHEENCPLTLMQRLQYIFYIYIRCVWFFFRYFSRLPEEVARLKGRSWFPEEKQGFTFVGCFNIKGWSCKDGLTQGHRIKCQDRRCYQFWKRNRMRWRHLDKLLKGKLAVHVLVHLPEDLVSSLFRSGLVLRHLEHRTNLGDLSLGLQLQRLDTS